MAAFKFSDVERKMDVENKKTKVMHLCSYLGYDGPSRGIIGQAKYTDDSNFHTTICEIKSTRNERLIKELINMGCGHLSLGINKVYDIRSIFRLARELKKNKIDILNTHNTLACWYGSIAAKLAGIPVVFTLRNLQSENYKFLFKKSFYSKPVIFIDSLFIKNSDVVVAVSERLRKYYIKNMGIPEKKILAINNAIDLEPLQKIYDKQQIRKELGIGNEEVIIGITGDLIERKNHVCLVEAAKIIAEKQGEIRFLIVGKGPLENTLKKRIEKYGIRKNFIFTGHVENIGPLLSIMDIFTLPSLAEGISRSLMESMAMGIPSVCSVNDGNLEAVVHGETGLIFPVNEYKTLAGHLLFLVNDRKARIEMGRKASERAQMLFNMKDYSLRYEKLYLNLTGKNF